MGLIKDIRDIENIESIYNTIWWEVIQDGMCRTYKGLGKTLLSQPESKYMVIDFINSNNISKFQKLISPGDICKIIIFESDEMVNIFNGTYCSKSMLNDNPIIKLN